MKMRIFLLENNFESMLRPSELQWFPVDVISVSLCYIKTALYAGNLTTCQFPAIL